MNECTTWVLPHAIFRKVRILIVILFFTLSLPVYSQKSNPKIENGLAYDKEAFDLYVDSLHDKNDFVVTFKIKQTAFRTNKDYIIVTKNADTFSLYKYIHQSFHHLVKQDLPADSIKLLWQAFVDNDLFTMKDSKEVSDNCPLDSMVKNGKTIYYSKVSISDSHIYELNILSKNLMKKLSYYDPEFFEKYCSSVNERKRIIECVAIIKSIVR